MSLVLRTHVKGLGVGVRTCSSSVWKAEAGGVRGSCGQTMYPKAQAPGQ